MYSSYYVVTVDCHCAPYYKLLISKKKKRHDLVSHDDVTVTQSYVTIEDGRKFWKDNVI